MNPESDKPEEIFFVKWIVATSGALVLGYFLACVVADICQLFFSGGKETNLVVAPCIAVVVGCAQWMLLRERIAVSGWWVLACAIGVGSPLVIEEILRGAGFLPDWTRGSGGTFLAMTILGILGGLLSGLLQMPLLRPHFTKASWWILASCIGWGFCWPAFEMLVNPGALSSAPSKILPPAAQFVIGLLIFLDLIFGPVLLGVVTGVGLLWMARFPVQESQNAVEPTNG